MTIQKSVTGLQIWLLLAVLGVSVSLLSFWAFSMYQTFEGLQKSVNQISSDIAVIKNDQKHQLVENSQLRLLYENLFLKVTDIDRRLLKIEVKTK